MNILNLLKTSVKNLSTPVAVLAILSISQVAEARPSVVTEGTCTVKSSITSIKFPCRGTYGGGAGGGFVTFSRIRNGQELEFAVRSYSFSSQPDYERQYSFEWLDGIGQFEIPTLSTNRIESISAVSEIETKDITYLKSGWALFMTNQRRIGELCPSDNWQKLRPSC